jgi:hypothetical protein
MWIVFGTKDASRRVPNGATVTRHCDACGETAVFYEKDKTSTFRLYFIDVFDYKKSRVMECGACGASYGTDELGDTDWTAAAQEKLKKGGQAIERFASAAESTITNLAAKAVNRPPPVRSADRSTQRERPRQDDLSEDDLAALDELDDLEMKFRKLEAEADQKKGKL